MCVAVQLRVLLPGLWRNDNNWRSGNAVPRLAGIVPVRLLSASRWMSLSLGTVYSMVCDGNLQLVQCTLLMGAPLGIMACLSGISVPLIDCLTSSIA